VVVLWAAVAQGREEGDALPALDYRGGESGEGDSAPPLAHLAFRFAAQCRRRTRHWPVSLTGRKAVGGD